MCVVKGHSDLMGLQIETAVAGEEDKPPHGGDLSLTPDMSGSDSVQLGCKG